MSRSERLGAVATIALLCMSCSLALPYPHVEPEICDNGVDDDLDGRTDCADDECASSLCPEASREECWDGRDNDADGLVDLAEPPCWRYGGIADERGCVSVQGVRTGDLSQTIVGWRSEEELRILELPDEGPVLAGPAGRAWRATHSQLLTGALDGTLASFRLRWTGEVGAAEITLRTPLESRSGTVESYAVVLRLSPERHVEVSGLSTEVEAHPIRLPVGAWVDVALAFVGGGWEIALASGGVPMGHLSPRPEDTWETTALRVRPSLGDAPPLELSIGGTGTEWAVASADRLSHLPCEPIQPMRDGLTATTSVAIHEGLVCVADGSGGLYLRSSDDGNEWEPYSFPPEVAEVRHVELATRPDGFVALVVPRSGVGLQGRMFESPDCERWEAVGDRIRLGTDRWDMEQILALQVIDDELTVIGRLAGGAELAVATAGPERLVEQRVLPLPGTGPAAALLLGRGVLWTGAEEETNVLDVQWADAATDAWVPIAQVAPPSQLPGTFDRFGVLPLALHRLEADADGVSLRLAVRDRSGDRGAMGLRTISVRPDR